MPIIDFRFRVPTPEFDRSAHDSHSCLWWKVRPTPFWRHEAVDRPGDLGSCLDWMSERDIIGVLPGRDMPCTSIPNDHLRDLSTAHPGRFVPFAGVDPSRGAAALAEIELRAAQGFKGIHLEVGWLQPTILPDDALIDPVYELCAQLGLIAIVHVGPLGGPDLAHTRPDALCRVARKFAGLRIVMAHAGYPFVDDAIMAVFKHDNLWLGPDPYLDFPGGERYREWANQSDFVAERLLYGSSFGWPHAPDALDRFIKSGWNDGVLDKLLYTNAAELLGLL
jgi:predicted TIM-barrel fold metal-dependent hydrolase